jgi:hypothetical protein
VLMGRGGGGGRAAHARPAPPKPQAPRFCVWSHFQVSTPRQKNAAQIKRKGNSGGDLHRTAGPLLRSWEGGSQWRHILRQVSARLPGPYERLHP